jgi:hypothetical protein
VAFESDERHLRAVRDPRLCATRYPARQPFLPTLDAVAWQPALGSDDLLVKQSRE